VERTRQDFADRKPALSSITGFHLKYSTGGLEYVAVFKLFLI
jgi:hypothetical protein